MPDDHIRMETELWEQACAVVRAAADLHRVISKYRPDVHAMSQADVATVVGLQDLAISLGFELMEFQELRYDGPVLTAQKPDGVAQPCRPCTSCGEPLVGPSICHLAGEPNDGMYHPNCWAKLKS